MTSPLPSGIGEVRLPSTFGGVTLHTTFHFVVGAHLPTESDFELAARSLVFSWFFGFGSRGSVNEWQGGSQPGPFPSIVAFAFTNFLERLLFKIPVTPPVPISVKPLPLPPALAVPVDMACDAPGHYRTAWKFLPWLRSDAVTEDATHITEAAQAGIGDGFNAILDAFASDVDPGLIRLVNVHRNGRPFLGGTRYADDVLPGSCRVRRRTLAVLSSRQPRHPRRLSEVAE